MLDVGNRNFVGIDHVVAPSNTRLISGCQMVASGTLSPISEIQTY
jgi:hypothetical protein